MTRQAPPFHPTLSLTNPTSHHPSQTPPQKPTTMTEPNTDVPSTSDPSGFLSEIIGAPITVKLNSGVEYRGKPPLPPCLRD